MKKYCDKCGCENVPWTTTDELWLKACKKEEFLCPLCFTKRLYKVISIDKYCIGFKMEVVIR